MVLHPLFACSIQGLTCKSLAPPSLQSLSALDTLLVTSGDLMDLCTWMCTSFCSVTSFVPDVVFLFELNAPLCDLDIQSPRSLLALAFFHYGYPEAQGRRRRYW